jgi:hypothetical protein
VEKVRSWKKHLQRDGDATIVGLIILIMSWGMKMNIHIIKNRIREATRFVRMEKLKRSPSREKIERTNDGIINLKHKLNTLRKKNENK